ncbi:MAG: hypothetical protein RMK32_00255 [Anaerolineae bacterium]|nr:hypothetical protein [Thermoflexus sp.]MDW8064046.1 hypothetical protein [Anaerolineae bacterium]
MSLWDLRAGLRALQALGQMADQTKAALAHRIQKEPLPEEAYATLHNALDHLSEVREGFILSLRTSAVPSLAELRTLVERVLMDWSAWEALGFRLMPAFELAHLGDQIFFFHHAYIAMGILPRLPNYAVTFPHQRRPSYADIPVPGTPAEVLDRIEEMEHVVWTAENAELEAAPQDSVRRTYAFFEASAWLVTTELAHWLGRRGRSLSPFEWKA